MAFQQGLSIHPHPGICSVIIIKVLIFFCLPALGFIEVFTVNIKNPYDLLKHLWLYSELFNLVLNFFLSFSSSWDRFTSSVIIIKLLLSFLFG